MLEVSLHLSPPVSWLQNFQNKKKMCSLETSFFFSFFLLLISSGIDKSLQQEGAPGWVISS